MQAWPDADFDVAHRHGVTAYGVTAFEPHDTFDAAVERLMYWHLVARQHPHLDGGHDGGRRATGAGRRARRAAALLAGRRLHRRQAAPARGHAPARPAGDDSCLQPHQRDLRRPARHDRAAASRASAAWSSRSATASAWCSTARTSAKRSTLEIIDGSRDPVIFSHSNPEPARAQSPEHRRRADPRVRRARRAHRSGRLGPAGDAPGHHALADARRVHRHGRLHRATSLGGTSQPGVLDRHVARHLSATRAPTRGATPPIPEHRRGVRTPRHAPTRARRSGRSTASATTRTSSRLADRMLARGLSEDDVRGILGEHALRLFDLVWHEAGRQTPLE